MCETTYLKDCGFIIIYSQGDGGYYGDIWEVISGKDLHRTPIYNNHREALEQTKIWINLKRG